MSFVRKGECFFFFFAVVSFSSGFFVRGPHFQTGNLNFSSLGKGSGKIYHACFIPCLPSSPREVREGGKGGLLGEVDEPCFGK